MYAARKRSGPARLSISAEWRDQAAFVALRNLVGKNVFVITGAGISAESGIQTFRDSGGLWEGQRLERLVPNLFATPIE